MANDEDAVQTDIQAKIAAQEPDLLRNLIDQSLLVQRAKDDDINVDADVVKKLDDIRQQNHINSMEDLELERGDLRLEDSIKMFEEGMRLSAQCKQELDSAESKVQILLKQRDGTLKAEPFPLKP